MAHKQKGYHMELIVLWVAACTILYYAGQFTKQLIKWLLLITTGKHHDL